MSVVDVVKMFYLHSQANCNWQLIFVGQESVFMSMSLPVMPLFSSLFCNVPGLQFLFALSLFCLFLFKFACLT